jgi:hypothetical protein
MRAQELRVMESVTAARSRRKPASLDLSSPNEDGLGGEQNKCQKP